MIELNKTRTSKVGAISKTQKAQNICFENNMKFLNFFARKMSHSAKTSKRGTLWAFSTSLQLQNIKKLKGGPFGDKKSFQKMSHSAEKN